MGELYKAGRVVQTTPGTVPQYKRYLDEMPGVPIQDLWTDLSSVNSQATEAVGYATQKPETLLERILQLSSDEGDLVADFFCGSGTTAVVAEKLGRKWIATDLGKFGIHTTRKRLIGIQREQKAAGKSFRAFEVLKPWAVRAPSLSQRRWPSFCQKKGRCPCPKGTRIPRSHPKGIQGPAVGRRFLLPWQKCRASCRGGPDQSSSGPSLR